MGDGPADLETVPAAALRRWEANPRTISKEGLEKVAESIRRFGFLAPIVARRSDGRIAAGHMRLRAAVEILGLDEVPVRWVELDDEELAAYAIADNRTAEEADWDRLSLAGVLEGFEDASELLASTGLTDDEVRELIRLQEIEFPEYDTDVQRDARIVTCPKCGEQFVP
jgi:ParB/RepB/Spo0J family partition protein